MLIPLLSPLSSHFRTQVGCGEAKAVPFHAVRRDEGKRRCHLVTLHSDLSEECAIPCPTSVSPIPGACDLPWECVTFGCGSALLSKYKMRGRMGFDGQDLHRQLAWAQNRLGDRGIVSGYVCDGGS